MNALALSWLLSLLLPMALFLALALILGRRAYAAKEKKTFSFLTMFPQEMFEGKDLTHRYARLFLYGFLLADALLSAYPLFAGVLQPGLMPIGVLLVVAVTLRNIAFVAVMWVPPYSFKAHLISFTSFGGFGIFAMALSGILFANLMAFDAVVSIVFLSLVGVVGVGEILLLLNPKLGQWTKMDSTMDEEGNVSVSRPKPFVLAFTQWLLLFLGVLGAALAAVGFALFVL